MKAYTAATGPESAQLAGPAGQVSFSDMQRQRRVPARRNCSCSRKALVLPYVKDVFSISIEQIDQLPENTGLKKCKILYAQEVRLNLYNNYAKWVHTSRTAVC